MSAEGTFSNFKKTKTMYTAKQIRDERISFKPMSEEQFDKNEDITLYVEDIWDTYNDLLKEKYSTKGEKYDFHPKDLIIQKTGCETKQTLLTEWLALYKLIKP
jgi:hypothetical protein